MSLKSMTGFARAVGGHGVWRWTWEIRAVNGKGLDARLRIAQGFDAIEVEARARVGRAISRGSLQINMTAERVAAPVDVRINEPALRKLIDAVGALSLPSGIQPASLDGLLALRGMVEIVEGASAASDAGEAETAALADLDVALAELVDARKREGAALEVVMIERVDRISALVEAAENAPGRKPEAIKARLARAIASLGEAGPSLDPGRLHQEALLLATRADIREEIDRLRAHVSAARELLASSIPSGRKLDFLAQEFGRESSTLCAKSNDPALTTIGMELRVEIEQFREQAQNIE